MVLTNFQDIANFKLAQGLRHKVQGEEILPVESLWVERSIFINANP
jgi:hypothetical protein